MPAGLVVLYDSDCGFCRATLAALLAWDRRARLMPEAIQSPDGQRLLSTVPEEQRLATAHVVTPQGKVVSGGDAVAPILRALPAGAPAALVAQALGGPARGAYGWVAGHRTGLSRFVPRVLKDRAAGRIERHRMRALAGHQAG